MASRHRPGLIFAAAAASVLLPLAGCGGSSKTESTAAANTPATTANTATAATTAPATTATKLALTADPTGAFKYIPSTLSAKAGSVEITFTNKSPLEHNLTVETASGQQLGGTPTFTNATHTLTLSNLKPGTYTFFCTVPGHRAAGMHGTLVVTA